MEYDIILVVGETYFDHPLSGAAIIRRLLEKNGYEVGIIELPRTKEDIARLGKPKLFFAVSSGSIDSMVRNYTPLKKRRDEDEHLEYTESVPDRAVIVFSNWIRQIFKDSIIVLGGIEASLRRFSHYDYWDNKLRKPILFDSRANILVYGSAEKQVLEIAKRIKNNQPLKDIEGTCILDKEIPENFETIPSWEEINESKEKFCDMQLAFTVEKNLAQKIDNRYILQYKYPKYTSNDIDEYYELPFTRNVPKELRGFEFSVVTHRGCIGDCNFCSLNLTQGNRIISRSEKSILNEIKDIARLPNFKGNIDDLGGPSANMYGMDCEKCDTKNCIGCDVLDKTQKRLLHLMKEAKKIIGIKNIYIKSGIRFDLCNEEYLKEVCEHHIFDTLRIAPEHTSDAVLKLMNKDKGDLDKFIADFKRLSKNKKLAFYFMTAHPGSDMISAKSLSKKMIDLRNCETVQIFTPTTMTM